MNDPTQRPHRMWLGPYRRDHSRAGSPWFGPHRRDHSRAGSPWFWRLSAVYLVAFWAAVGAAVWGVW